MLRSLLALRMSQRANSPSQGAPQKQARKNRQRLAGCAVAAATTRPPPGRDARCDSLRLNCLWALDTRGLGIAPLSDASLASRIGRFAADAVCAMPRPGASSEARPEIVPVVSGSKRLRSSPAVCAVAGGDAGLAGGGVASVITCPVKLRLLAGSGAAKATFGAGWIAA